MIILCFFLSLLFLSLQEAETQRGTFSLGSSIYDGTPLQYSCLENPMDGGAW